MFKRGDIVIRKSNPSLYGVVLSTGIFIHINWPTAQYDWHYNNFNMFTLLTDIFREL